MNSLRKHGKKSEKDEKSLMRSSRALRGAVGSSSRNLPSSSQALPPLDSQDDNRLTTKRRQNNESAKRCRERKRAEEVEMQKQYIDNFQIIEKLEKQVQGLEAVLHDKRKSKSNRPSSSKKKTASSSSSTGEFFEPQQRFFGDPF